MGLKAGIVRLDEYNPDWEKEFELEKKNLAVIFGNVAKSIEHIGSTSILGLSAKPIIDIAVGVQRLSDFEKVRDRFVKMDGYSIKEDSVSDEMLVRKGSEDNRTHFIHVMETNSERYINTILFRDYLRSNIEVTMEYQELKEKLAKKYPENRTKYIEGKTQFITNILEKARKE